jgi:hypothetical protein
MWMAPNWNDVNTSVSFLISYWMRIEDVNNVAILMSSQKLMEGSLVCKQTIIRSVILKTQNGNCQRKYLNISVFSNFINTHTESFLIHGSAVEKGEECVECWVTENAFIVRYNLKQILCTNVIVSWSAVCSYYTLWSTGEYEQTQKKKENWGSGNRSLYWMCIVYKFQLSLFLVLHFLCKGNTNSV